MAAKREAGANRQIDRRSIQHRQRAGKPETHRAHVRVRRRAERRAAAAEDLGSGPEVRVNLETDDGLKEHDKALKELGNWIIW